MILDYFRSKLIRLLMPPKQQTQKRMYAAAKTSRVSSWGQSNTSADSELNTSLRSLRTKSRALVRDASYAKRAKVIIVNNIVGMGIGMQAQVGTSRGNLNKRINDDIERAWEIWGDAKYCHTGGTLHFSDLERMVMGQVFEAGEVIIRKHYKPFGGSDIPFVLEIIEAERICDEYQPGALSPDNNVKMGVEVDRYNKPVAYWIRELHPGELRYSMNATDRVERVPADQIIHLRMIDRWPQTRGEPWLHTAAVKLNDMDGYSEAEIVAARGAANYMGIIESQDIDSFAHDDPDKPEEPPTVEIEPGITQRLMPGEKYISVEPNRPNPNMDPFMRLMLREVAAGVGVSYESISRDYSQSNYSSSRLALIDDRDLWRTLQMWFIRNLRQVIHKEWLQQAVLSRAITTVSIDEYAYAPDKFEAVRFKPRGWSWVDPTKEVEAYKEAIRGGFMTVGEVISLTGGGRDLEDVLQERKQELEMMEEAGLKFDTEYEEKTETPQQEPDKEAVKDDQKERMNKVISIAQRRDYVCE